METGTLYLRQTAIETGVEEAKRLTLTGSTLRPRSREVKAGFARALEAQVWPLLAAGKLKVVMDSTFPLADAAAAHRRLETSQHIGKIVLTV